MVSNSGYSSGKSVSGKICLATVCKYNNSIMEDKITSFNVHEEIESRYAYTGVFLSAVAFQIAYQILIITGPPKSVETEEWKFRKSLHFMGPCVDSWSLGHFVVSSLFIFRLSICQSLNIISRNKLDGDYCNLDLDRP